MKRILTAISAILFLIFSILSFFAIREVSGLIAVWAGTLLFAFIALVFKTIIGEKKDSKNPDPDRSAADQRINSVFTDGENANKQTEEERFQKIDQENLERSEQRYSQFTSQSFHEKSIELFTDRLLSSLVDLFEASHGLIYLSTENDDQEMISLKIVATYAHVLTENDKRTFTLEDGFVGQVIKDRKLNYIDNVPNGYIKVFSGLGQATPGYLVISPLIHNKKIIGVAEIASFKEFNKYDLDLVERISGYMCELLFPMVVKKDPA